MCTIRVRQKDKFVLMQVHGGMSESELYEAGLMWEKNNFSRPIVMIATTAFGSGIDRDDIDSIIIAGSCPSMVDFVQQSRRGGRGGKKCTVRVLYHNDHDFSNNFSRQEEREIRETLGNFSDWVKNTNVCRRISISQFVDETSDMALTCYDLEKVEKNFVGICDTML